MTDTKLEAFIRNLKKIHGLTHEDFKKQYDYAGSNKMKIHKDGEKKASFGLIYAEKKGINFKMREKLHTNYCLCGTQIKENIYRQNKDMKTNIIVIGNICNLRYKLGRIRKCSMCGEAHQNRKDNYCNSCRKERKARKKSVKKKVEREKERFEQLKNHEYIHIDDLKEGSYYRYTRDTMYPVKRRNCVFFRLININKNELVCQSYKKERTWIFKRPLKEGADFIFYKRNY